MTIIAILLAFALCHFVRELGSLRRHEWLGHWISRAEELFGNLPAWNAFTGYAIILFIPFVIKRINLDDTDDDDDETESQ